VRAPLGASDTPSDDGSNARQRELRKVEAEALARKDPECVESCDQAEDARADRRGVAGRDYICLQMNVALGNDGCYTGQFLKVLHRAVTHL
jgi:hypothetical protein